MRRELQGAVVVITGASSGIGRAAAHRFAEHGSRLVLAARAERPLTTVADACGEAIAVPTDVRDEQAVTALARRAVDRFGRIDAWVNCAGVMAYGRFEAVPAEIFRQIIETNLLGQVHGARAALPQFRHQGAGVLINMASVWGRLTTPDVSAYVTSKFAVRAFSECLRQELRDSPGIAVATILPAAVDTPIFAQAGNYSGRRVRPIPPTGDPWTIADGIVRCAANPKREVTYGRVARLLEIIYAFAPVLYARFAPDAFAAGNFAPAPAEPSPGNVSHPIPDNERIDGLWRSRHRRVLVDAFLAASGAAVRNLAPERYRHRRRG
jgi:NAD(P)-dependent dehydrogenase (short-subunit alcohol dehydrogenase family)